MDARTIDDFRFIEECLKGMGAPLSTQGRLTRLRVAFEDCEAKHVKINMTDPGTLETMVEAVLGPLLEAGDKMADLFCAAPDGAPRCANEWQRLRK